MGRESRCKRPRTPYVGPTHRKRSPCGRNRGGTLWQALPRATARRSLITSTTSPTRGRRRRLCCCCMRRWAAPSAITPGFRRSPAIIGWCGWICAGMAVREIPPADRPLTLERLVADVAELMDHLGIGQRPYRRQFGRRLSRPATGDEPRRAGAQLDAVRLDPGAQEQPGAELDPADPGKGSARLSRRDDRRPAAARPGRSRVSSNGFSTRRPRTTRPISANSSC